MHMKLSICTTGAERREVMSITNRQSSKLQQNV